MSYEKRVDKRQELSWVGEIFGLDGVNFGGCKIFDISASGARLVLRGETQVPDEFVLLLAKDGSVQRQCRVRWRTDAEIGVQFVRPTVDARRFAVIDAGCV